MSHPNRRAALALIEQNISVHGHHVYLVTGGASPRFAYSIGLHATSGSEVVFAGGGLFDADEVWKIVDAAAKHLRGPSPRASSFQIAGLGEFTFRPLMPEWTGALLLGALDFYDVKDLSALQIVPDHAHWTIDVPDLSSPMSDAVCWRWLEAKWPYAAPAGSVVVTNLRALKGGHVSEAVRWEHDQWEMFSGSSDDVTDEQIRVVPLATLVGADSTLVPALALEVGKGIRRSTPRGMWKPWGQ